MWESLPGNHENNYCKCWKFMTNSSRCKKKFWQEKRIRMLAFAKKRYWKKVVKKHTINWKQQCIKKMLKMAINIHCESEKQQHP